MASPLFLALAATTALVAAPAMACEGHCWGMSPVQEANPGYQPDYSQYPAPEGYGPEQPGPDQAGPPPGYDEQGGPGDQGYGPPPGPGGPDGYGPPPQYGPGYGSPPSGGYDRGPAVQDNRPYIGPVEGLADDYGAAPDQSQAQGPGYGQPYGPPPAYGYGAEGGYNGEGEPPSAYQAAPPPPPTTYSYDRYSYGAAPYAGQGPRWASGQEREAPYQAYSQRGYERYRPWRREDDGSWRKSYRAGSVHTYDYDSGWVEDQPHGGWAMHRPMQHGGWGPPPAAGPGPAPCTECGETY